MGHKPLIVIGSGGHARVLIEALLCAGARILGALDNEASRMGADVLGVRVLGDDSVLGAHAPAEVDLVCGVGSIAPGSPRSRIYSRLRERGYAFAGVVHPSAVIARDVELAADAQIMAGAVIQPGARIGHNAILNTGCLVDHDCSVSDHAHVAPGAVLCGAVRIGHDAHVGAGATVVPGIAIGAEAFVYAGAVVTCDVPSGARVAGVPAREIGR